MSKDWSTFNGVFSKVYKFNKDRGLLDKGFDYNREAGFLMSESLELIDNKAFRKHDGLESLTNDEHARHIMNWFKTDESPLDKAVKYIDTWADQFVFGAGAGMKMGLPIGTLVQILNIVMEANLQKTGGINEDGKQQKGTAFKSPDEQIREILILSFMNLQEYGSDEEMEMAEKMLEGAE